MNPITVKLGVKTLMYDIQNTTHLTGISRRAENPGAYEATAHMQASADAEHSAKIRRSIAAAFAAVKVELSEYLSEDNTTATNLVPKVIKEDGVLVLAFNMPSNFQRSAVDALGQALHSYIVNRSISEWFGITNKAEAEYYASMAGGGLEEARKALYNRKAPEEPAEYISFGGEDERPEPPTFRQGPAEHMMCVIAPNGCTLAIRIDDGAWHYPGTNSFDVPNAGSTAITIYAKSLKGELESDVVSCVVPGPLGSPLIRMSPTGNTVTVSLPTDPGNSGAALTVMYRIGEGEWQEYTAPFELQEGDAGKVIQAKVVDGNGLQVSAIGSYQVPVEWTPSGGQLNAGE